MDEDKRIAEIIRERLSKEESLRAQDINVDVQEGVVYLSGTVDSEWARQVAEGLAGTAGNVQMVVNNLKVKEELPP